jgi:uracil-DNA glycosylase
MDMIEFDKGPPLRFARHFAACPDYGPLKQHFWYDWGPIFHRGRLNGTARVICLASDPGATERIAGRTLVGDAGQRVQGFLSKLGLTRSYLCLNAFSYALIPAQASKGDDVLTLPDQLAWRNRLFDMAHDAKTQAIIAFGRQAQKAIDLWPGKGATPVFDVPHPSSHDETVMLDAWRDAIVALRAIVTPDADGDAALPNYGATFLESDYAPIPRRDLPFGAPDFLGDDRAGRAATPPQRTSVRRPQPDDRHTLIWVAPRKE